MQSNRSQDIDDILQKKIDEMIASLTKKKLCDAFKKARKDYWAGRGEACNSNQYGGALSKSSHELFGRGILSLGIYNIYRAFKADRRIIEENKFYEDEVKIVLKFFLESKGRTDVLSLKYLVISRLLNERADRLKSKNGTNHFYDSYHDGELDIIANKMVRMVYDRLVNETKSENKDVHAPTLLKLCAKTIVNSRLFSCENKNNIYNLSRLPQELRPYLWNKILRK